MLSDWSQPSLQQMLDQQIIDQALLNQLRAQMQLDQVIHTSPELPPCFMTTRLRLGPF